MNSYYEIMLEIEQERAEEMENRRWEEEWCEIVSEKEKQINPPSNRVEIAEEDYPF